MTSQRADYALKDVIGHFSLMKGGAKRNKFCRRRRSRKVGSFGGWSALYDITKVQLAKSGASEKQQTEKENFPPLWGIYWHAGHPGSSFKRVFSQLENVPACVFCQGANFTCVSGWLRARGSIHALSDHQKALIIQTLHLSHLATQRDGCSAPTADRYTSTGQRFPLDCERNHQGKSPS